ncbi:unnamed protein product [Ambrosiozyma monospora]|uniref:Unnamed protein product n=1 Tax=Ambrosiozyma monospora TaxID=43982 RepID=A0A9W6YQB6_AMBMO|nr:unnamed protein product [Ambrosiozyma monospora]
MGTYSSTEHYTNFKHPDFIPGTINLLHDKADEESTNTSNLKTSKNGIILHPQPTDSPNDPLNWKTSTKTYQLILLLFITGFTAATANDAGSVQESMNEIYDISYDSMNVGAGVLFATIGLTTLILGPTSSLYGRKISYVICISMGLIGAGWFAAAKRTSDTIWSQLFVGASEACAEATVQLSIADMFFSHQLSHILTLYIIATSVGTYLGPLIAGFVVQYAGFRWVGWIALIISCVLLAVIIVTQFETYFDRLNYGEVTLDRGDSEIDSDTVEDEKEDAINEESTSLSKKAAEVSKESEKTYAQKIAIITPSNNLKNFGIGQYFERLFAMLRVFWFPPVLYSGFLWGLQDTFLTFYLTTEDNDYYDEPYSYSNQGVAMMNIPCVIGALLGCIYAGSLSDKFVIWLAKRRGGVQEAEDYLWFLFSLCVICPVGLIIFAIGTDRAWSWKVTYTLGLGFLGFSFGCAGDIAMAYLMAAYPEMVLEGMIGVACINNGISCVFTFACSPWLEKMGNTNTYIILAAVQFAAIMLNIPLIWYGKRIRKWTKKNYVSYIETRDGKL